ncbi:MAG: glyoxalase [Bryobacterales bacterium]|jgi:catechol 2,3-dioxygenase-like lactoylglutathione lyase family enzyme|nr:glyoxalase [Bryobacterales bacterium]
MTITGLLETGIYVDDVPRAAEFYRRIFEFSQLEGDDRFCALSVAGRDVLLIFKKGGTLKPLVMPSGVMPPHDGSGQQHFAFSVPASDLPAWEQRLEQNGVAIESRVTWPRGGRSIYFRDPDGHLVELVTPGCWAIY